MRAELFVVYQAPVLVAGGTRAFPVMSFNTCQKPAFLRGRWENCVAEDGFRPPLLPPPYYPYSLLLYAFLFFLPSSFLSSSLKSPFPAPGPAKSPIPLMLTSID